MRDVPLGTLIFRAGLLGEEQLENALQEGMRSGKRLGEVLLERGWLNERDLGRMLAGQKGLPFVDVALSDVEPDALQALSHEDARRQVALPLFYEDGELVIAVGDPSNEVVLEGLRREIETDFQLVVAPHGQLLEVIEEAYARAAEPASEPESEPSGRAFEGVLFPDLTPRTIRESAFEPEPEAEAQPDRGFAPAEEAETEPQAEEAPVPEAHAGSEPEPDDEPSSSPAPTLLSRMLFPSVRHAAQEAEAAAQPVEQEEPAAAEPEEPPAAEQEELPAAEQEEASAAEQPEEVEQPEAPAPAAVEDFAELEVPAPPEMPVSSFEEPAAEAQPAPPEETSEPLAEAEPAPAEAPEPAPEPEPVPEPAAEQPPEVPQPTTHAVIVRLRDGDAVRIGEHPNAAAASAQAAKTVAQISSAAASGKWPLFDGRYLSPDTIVSVDLLEESNA